VIPLKIQKGLQIHRVNICYIARADVCILGLNEDDVAYAEKLADFLVGFTLRFFNFSRVIHKLSDILQWLEAIFLVKKNWSTFLEGSLQVITKHCFATINNSHDIEIVGLTELALSHL